MNLELSELVGILDKDKLWYLASPYSKYPTGLEDAFVRACEITADFLRLGVTVYSPIAHTHPVAMHGNIDPYSHDIWLAFDNAMIKACDGLIVACLEGWMHSKGIEYELSAFLAVDKPIFYLGGR